MKSLPQAPVEAHGAIQQTEELGSLNVLSTVSDVARVIVAPVTDALVDVANKGNSHLDRSLSEKVQNDATGKPRRDDE